jgi:hypothetical protein
LHVCRCLGWTIRCGLSAESAQLVWQAYPVVVPARKAKASIARVVQQYQEVQFLTRWMSRPVWVLTLWKFPWWLIAIRWSWRGWQLDVAGYVAVLVGRLTDAVAG